MATSGTFTGANADEAAVFAFVLESGSPPPVNDGTAATAFNWGSPLGSSDEFEYTGAPSSTKWEVYSGPGRDGKGTRSPAQATVSNGKLVLTGTETGVTAALAQKFDQQYGRWEIRARAVETVGTGGGTPIERTPGVGGIPSPPAGPNVVLATGNTTSPMTISTSGTASNYRIYDGRGFTVGKISVRANYVIVQNYRVIADDDLGISVRAHHAVVQHCDVKDVHAPGDLNAMEVFGNDISILYNTCENFITGDAGGSHTDAIQTWNQVGNESTSRLIVQGNRFTGAPSEGPSTHIHQALIGEGADSNDGGGGGTGASTDWFIADNYWTADCKFDDIDNVTYTRNTMAGNDKRAVVLTSLSTGFKYYSDNIVTGNLSVGIGATVIPGPGPARAPWLPAGDDGTGGGTPPGASYHPILTILPTATTPGPGPGPGPGTGTTTGGSGGPLTDRTNVAYGNGTTSSVGHIYAAGLDWTRPVGVLFYTDGSGEFGLANTSSTYLLGGTNGLIAVAKKHNMVLVTPRAPGGGCDDGDGVCWYDSSGSMNIPTKIKWADDFIRNMVLTKYNIDLTRVVISGYSSGAQFTAEYYGPQYASAWMQDGLLLSISYGGSPKVTANYPTAFKTKVAAVWDVGANDSAYQGGGEFDAQSGYDWYRTNGFTTTELNVVPNLGHARDGQFGAVVDREITQHITPISNGGGTGGGFTAHVFVSTTGSDTNSGTSASSPKRTIAAAMSVVQPGQTISVADGTYSGNLETTKGGASGNFITIRAANKWGAIISGNNDTSDEACVSVNHQYVRIQDMTLTGTSGSGVRHGVYINVNNVEIVGCHIYNICQFLTEGTSWQGGAGIDMTSPSKSNILIDGNVIHDIGLRSSTQQLVHGIYCGVHATNCKIINNLIYECEDFGVHPYDETEASAWQVINNTVLSCGRGILQAPNGVTRNNIVHNVSGRHYDIRGSGNTGSNNFYSGSGTGITGASFATSVSNPMFVNASTASTADAHPDARLQSGSPLIDAGTTTGAPAKDILGATRPAGAGIDVGAYEFGATVTQEASEAFPAAVGTEPPEHGEYDFFETIKPGDQTVQAFLRYPRTTALPVQQEVFTKSSVDTSQFHNYAFEWTPDHVKGFIDGEQWFIAGGGANSTRQNLQSMLSGHLAILLDNFDGTTQNLASFEIEWARAYSLTPSGGGTGSQTITAVGISSREAFGTALVTGGTTSPPPGSVPTQLGINTVLGAFTLGYTQGEGEPPPPGTQAVRPFGIPTGQAFGLATFTVPDGPPSLAAVGIPSAAAFGRPTVIADPPAAPAPGGVLVPALYAVGSDGTTLTPIPSWTKIRVSPVRNSAGSLTIEYPAGAPGFQLLHDSVSASPLKALEIRLWLGGNNTFALGGWLVQKSGDDLTPGSSWQFTGHFHEWLLTKAIVGPQAISEANKTGSLNFAGANPGLILTTIMDQAQARGAMPYMTRDFTTTHDSNGQAWAKSISSLKLAPKTTVFDVVNKLFELGMCEFEVTPGRIWRAFNPEGQGADRTLGGSPLVFAQARNLSEHARRESSRDAGTAVLVAGSEGFYKFVSSATAQAQLGWRAEVGADAGQLTSQAAVDAVAESYLEKARAGVAEYSSAIEFGPGERLPMIDYKVGDWAYTSTTSGRRRLRIAQIELEFGVGAPPRGKVVQNDLITDRLTALYRKLAAISTGDAVVGTSEPTSGGLGEDTNPPAAPIGVTVSSSFAYQIPGDATTYAEVAVGWQAVNTNLYADEVIAGKVRAAEIIGGRLRAAADPIFEDWTWGDAPEIVTLHNDALLQEWESDPSNPGGDDNTFSAEALAWLTVYPASKQGGGAVTSDVSHYVVQYQYLGQSGTGGFFDPRNPDAEFGFWGTAEGSPTQGTLLIFGGVTGGRAVGVRVAAVDNTGNQGPFSDVVGTMTAVDDIPPPSPSKPGAKGGFRTVQVTWDGKGSSGEDMVLAAADILSGGGVEIHIAEGIDFTPERPIGPNGKVDLSTSTTYRNTFYDAGSLTFAGFENGVTYFARLVAVDRNGNASDPSETSEGATPNKLVTIDYGPDTIDRATIKAAAIGSAEIDLLAVNEQHVGTVNASSIVSGIMSADVSVAGRFATPMSSTGNQLEFDSAGIRLSRGGSIVGRWQVFDASMLVTGQYQTAMTGSRIVINPGSSQPDTMRFYPTFTDAYSSIDSVDFAGGTVAGIRIIGSANISTGNAGMLLIRDQWASLVHGRRDLSFYGSEVWVEQAFTRNKSATVDLIVDERIQSQFGPRRVAMIHWNSNNQPINATGLYYGKTGAFGGEPMLYANGQDVNLVFGGTDGVTSSRLLVRNNANTQFREIAAGAFVVSSSGVVKHDIREFSTDPMQYLRTCGPKHFRRDGDLEDDAERLGFIAEEMPPEVRQPFTVSNDDGPAEVIETLDPMSITALLWAATQRIDERVSALEQQ